MGAQPWVLRVHTQAKAAGVKLATYPRQPGHDQERAALTETEVQLVQLMRRGLTNRQISSALHYSAKTIEVYVSRLYQKVGCHSRLELVLAAERGELGALPAGGGEPDYGDVAS